MAFLANAYAKKAILTQVQKLVSNAIELGNFDLINY